MFVGEKKIFPHIYPTNRYSMECYKIKAVIPCINFCGNVGQVGVINNFIYRYNNQKHFMPVKSHTSPRLQLVAD